MICKVLVVDDDQGALDVLIYSLQRMGFTEIVSAQSGQEALEKFRVGEFGLVISDVEMPGLDGFSLARTIFEQDTNQPLILMSSNKKYGETAARAAIHFLMKGYGPKELKEAIESSMSS